MANPNNGGWRPQIEPQGDFNPFAKPEGRREILTSPKLLEPDEDTAPLQGSHDLSDDDSLEDVVADENDDHYIGLDDD